MDYTKKYHLVINDFRIEESRGILFLDNKLDCSRDVLKALEMPILRGSDFSTPWGQIFTPKVDQKVWLRVYGSEFTKKLFFAYAQAKRIEGVKFYYDEKIAGLKLKLWDESFHSRFSRFLKLFLKLKEKDSSENVECRNVPVQLVCNCDGKTAERLAGKIEQTFKDYCQLFNLLVSCSVIKDKGEATSTSVAICGVESSDVFKIAISDCCQNKKFESNPPTDRILFIIDKNGEDNVLTPRDSLGDSNCEWYTWRFKDEEVLVATIVSYIESYLLAPLFTIMWRDFGEQKLHLMKLSDRAEWYSLTRVFPFVVEEVPKDAEIGNEFNVNVLSFGCDLDENDTLALEGCKLVSIDSDELTIVNNQIHIVQTVARCDQPAEIQCRNNIFFKNIGKCDYIQVAMDKNCKNTIVIHKYDCKTDECQNQIINVKNHNLTTDCEVFVNGDRCYEYDMAVGGTIDVSVRGTNRYEKANTPKDANSWTYELERYDDVECKPSDGVECKVHEKNGCRTLSVLSNASGKFYLRFLWNGKRKGSCFIRMKPRVEKIDCELTPIDTKLAVSIRRCDNGTIEVECFRGQEIELAAKAIADGCRYPDDIYNPGFVFKHNGNSEVSCKEGQFKQVLHFRKAGKKLLKFQSCDTVANKAKIINVNVKENKSDVMLVSMISGIVLAWFFFFLNYGIGLWTFLAYLIPAGVMYWYRRMRYPQYTKTMFCLVGVDLIMFLWSVIQEIS